MTRQAASRNEAVSLADEGQVKEALSEAILGLWDVVNSITRLRPSRRERYRITIVLVGKMWPGLVEWVRSSILASDPPLASPPDFEIPRCVAGADEAIALIRADHARWPKENGRSRSTDSSRAAKPSAAKKKPKRS